MLLKNTLVLVEVLLIATAACGIPLANFSRFGNETGDSFLLSGDDENARIAVSPSLLFFNATHTHIYVSIHDLHNLSLLLMAILGKHQWSTNSW